MRIVARRTLRDFVSSLQGHADQQAVSAALDAWYREVSRDSWKSAAELKAAYRNASIVTAKRAVFNIKGNDYRLVVAIDYGKSVSG
jgi:mRNA interferase HigB